MKSRLRIFFAWFWVVLCTLAIFLVVPTARAIQKFVSEHWGRSLFGYSVLAATGAAFLAVLYIIYFRLKIRSLANYIWLAIVAALYVYFTLRLWRNPEEAVHFLEYGLLGYFLFRALRFSIKDKSIFLSAFLIGSLVGIFDEILQWVMPGRYWDIRDVGLNALAVGLFQVALWKGVMSKAAFESLRPRSFRIPSILFSLNLVLLGLCMSNTPERVSAFAERFPSFAFLEKEESMREFKIRHKDPEIGIFYSRLSIEWLKKMDMENSFSYGQILREWRDKDYNLFLQTFPPVSHPFLYEIRVHLFRRDRKHELGLKARDEHSRKEAFFIAFKENQILEKYFSLTLNASGCKWSGEKIQSLEAWTAKSAAYTSPVSKDLFTWLSEKAMWLAIIFFLITSVVLHIRYSPKKRSS